MKHKRALLLLPLILVFLFSCVNDQIEFEEFTYSAEDYSLLTQSLDLPQNPLSYVLNTPAHVMPITRQISDNRATLGRVLFYDKSLSKNGTVSCASCHKQEIAFSDNLKFSLGFNGEETARNSIALGSVTSFAGVYGSSTQAGTAFFWDERASSASEQSILSITDDIEMGMSHEELLQVVSSKDYYRVLFKAAFPNDEITEAKILFALESFVDAIGSFDSKLDKAMSHNGGTRRFDRDLFLLSDEENRGKALFIQHCEACHGNQFAGPTLVRANNGLDLIYDDKGIGGVIPLSNMQGVFKVPSLRNIALTAPYMHDGRFENLAEVIDFYSSDIQDHKNLDVNLKTPAGEPKRMNFSEKDKQELISFLETLTDESFLTAEKYADPFK